MSQFVEEIPMPQYAILVYDNQAAMADAGPHEIDQLMKDHSAFIQRNTNVLRGGHALLPGSTAFSIRRDHSGAPDATAGPYADTTDVLGGYYLIDVPGPAEAVVIAKQVPAPFGGVEVRGLQTVD
jgi:hypothetical protein